MKIAKKEQPVVRKLTPHDLAFGIGRKVTDEEWSQLIEDTKGMKFYTSDEVSKRVHKNLDKVKKKHIATSKV